MLDSAFLKHLKVSGLLDEEQLSQVSQLSGQIGDDRSLAKKLVADGKLTRYQAEQLLGGRASRAPRDVLAKLAKKVDIRIADV